MIVILKDYLKVEVRNINDWGLKIIILTYSKEKKTSLCLKSFLHPFCEEE